MGTLIFNSPMLALEAKETRVEKRMGIERIAKEGYSPLLIRPWYPCTKGVHDEKFTLRADFLPDALAKKNFRIGGSEVHVKTFRSLGGTPVTPKGAGVISQTRHRQKSPSKHA